MHTATATQETDAGKRVSITFTSWSLVLVARISTMNPRLDLRTALPRIRSGFRAVAR
jgi:hypothetical protein